MSIHPFLTTSTGPLLSNVKVEAGAEQDVRHTKTHSESALMSEIVGDLPSDNKPNLRRVG